MIGSKSRVHVTAALAAMWLTACGGGGGGGDAVVAPPPTAGGPTAPAPEPAPAPAPGPAPAPAPAPATAVVVTASTQMATNTSYDVNSPTATPVQLKLPATAAANDTISVKGTSATPWLITQAAGQSILTSKLAGNVAPGVNWTARMAPKVWHWISSDTTGQVLLAGEAAQGLLNTSTDGGQTWTNGNSTQGIWISSDMSADGSVMFAVQYQGTGMYKSVDKGVTWTQVASPLFTGQNLSFESVTVSQDGRRVAAVSQNGNLMYSNDSGATWTAAAFPAGGPQTFAWRSVDSSADGSVIVAVSQDPHVFISTDAGVTFKEVAIDIGTAATPAPVFDNWYRVKTSADGKTIAMVGNSFGGSPGTGIYVSHDQGATWKRGFNLTADYTALAMSSDGSKISATVSNANPPVAPATTTTAAPTGRVLTSTDGGATFTAVTMPGTDTDWRAIAMSADGNKMATAAGRFTTPATGQLYTTQGNRTSIGTAGSITGGQGGNVTLQYLGNSQWSVTSSAGGPFSIK
jgi:hypothetical protein